MKDRRRDRDRPAVQVIGVGNPWRRDDGVGLVVARALTHASSVRVKVDLCMDGPAGLLDLLAGTRRLILIDALHSPAGPCHARRFDGRRSPLKRVFATSSHGMGLAETLELADALGILPEETIVYGVEGRDFSHGEGLSPEARIAAGECLQALLTVCGGSEARLAAGVRRFGPSDPWSSNPSS